MRFIKFFIINLLFISIFIIVNYVLADSNINSQPSLVLRILSNQALNGTAGDYTSVKAQIQNVSLIPINNITTYLSLVDEKTKLPVDLEDWSAEKGLFIGTIDAGQTLPLIWKIHFVKAGTYSLIIVAEVAGNETPQTSSIIQFKVDPKINLNPGKVLPVALGMPIILIFTLFILSSRRRLEE